MNSHTSSTTGSPASLNSGASSAGSSGPNSSSPRAPPNNNIQQIPGSHTFPSPVPHHRQVLQQLLQTLRLPSSPQQQDQILHILKSNPQVMTAFIKQRQQQQQQQQQAQQQQQPQAQQQAMQRVPQQLQSNNPPAPPASLSLQQQTVNSGSSGAGLMNQNSAASQPALIDLDNLRTLLTLRNNTNTEPQYRQALHRLREVLGLPNTPQQQDQILHILKTNPQLMTAFIKQRQQQQAQQQLRSNNSSAPPASLPPQQQTVNNGPSGASLMNQNSAPAASQPAPIDLDMQVLLTMGNSTNTEPHYRQALHQLTEVLRLPSSSQQQDQIVEIIGSNPQLMEEFVKQKQLLQQQQHSREPLPQQQQVVDPPSEQQQEQQLELNDILSDEWLDRLENFIESNRC